VQSNKQMSGFDTIFPVKLYDQLQFELCLNYFRNQNRESVMLPVE